ncbi:talin-like [Corticium candelabrum]|uniref:talin-like n=1 Tax=Corticium candelabrum TaxID=121492 RepID=UPI002E25E884|nr:talin-like [Corticium candelabrum]
MTALTLRVKIAEQETIKTMQFVLESMVYDACQTVADSFDIPAARAKYYGLFLIEAAPGKGKWLDNRKDLGVHCLTDGVSGVAKFLPLIAHLLSS